jgi:hypothetical protein
MREEQAKGWLTILDQKILMRRSTHHCGLFRRLPGIARRNHQVNYSAYPNVKRWLDGVAKLRNWRKFKEAFDGLVDGLKTRSFVTFVEASEALTAKVPAYETNAVSGGLRATPRETPAVFQIRKNPS